MVSENEALPGQDIAKVFYQKYEPKEILGKGASSTVRRCVLKVVEEVKVVVKVKVIVIVQVVTLVKVMVMVQGTGYTYFSKCQGHGSKLKVKVMIRVEVMVKVFWIVIVNTRYTVLMLRVIV